MAIKKILTVPDQILRKKSLPVEDVNKEIKVLLKDMLETMYDAPGIGLAAIQIGVPKRLVVMDLSKNPEKKEPMFSSILKLFLSLKKCRYMKRDVYQYLINLQKFRGPTHVE